MTTEARTVSVAIGRLPGVVYDYLENPAHIPEWSDFITGMRPDGAGWIATTAGGEVRMLFTPRNGLGVLDHWVKVSAQFTVYVPFRVIANGEGSEVLFTMFRQQGMTGAAFEADVGLVRADLGKLKRTLEVSSG